MEYQFPPGFLQQKALDPGQFPDWMQYSSVNEKLSKVSAKQGFVIDSGQYTGFRNRLINGNFDIWQRGTGSFNGVAYTADRWQCAYNSGGANFNVSVGIPPVDIGAVNAIYIYNDGGSVQPRVQQKIERDRSRDLLNKQVTVSFWAKRTTHSDQLRILLYLPSADDNYTGGAVFQSIDQTLTTAWAKYTVTFNALTADVVHGLMLSFIQLGSGTGYIYISQVQLEEGTYATPFESRPYGIELALCQRFYEISVSPPSAWSGMVTSGYTYLHSTPFKVNKRIAPNVVLTSYDATNFGTVTGVNSTSHWGFRETRVASATAAVGIFSSTWTADAEIP